MCFGGRGKEDEAEASRSRELDKQIRADEKRLSKEVKLLLLGTELQLLLGPTLRPSRAYQCDHGDSNLWHQ